MRHVLGGQGEREEKRRAQEREGKSKKKYEQKDMQLIARQSEVCSLCCLTARKVDFAAFANSMA